MLLFHKINAFIQQMIIKDIKNTEFTYLNVPLPFSIFSAKYFVVSNKYTIFATIRCCQALRTSS
jgi:hypothetical protein